MIAIHKVHRKLAELVYMNTDKDGKLILEQAELKLLFSLLNQNLDLVHKLDSLKKLSFMAYEMGDNEWQHDICQRIDELEAQCIL